MGDLSHTHTHLQDAFQLHSSPVSLFEDGVSLSYGLLQNLSLPLHHHHTDLPEEGLRQHHVGLQTLKKLLRRHTHTVTKQKCDN